jgi:hypothetical protein
MCDAIELWAKGWESPVKAWFVIIFPEVKYTSFCVFEIFLYRWQLRCPALFTSDEVDRY